MSNHYLRGRDRQSEHGQGDLGYSDETTTFDVRKG